MLIHSFIQLNQERVKVNSSLPLSQGRGPSSSHGARNGAGGHPGPRARGAHARAGLTGGPCRRALKVLGVRHWLSQPSVKVRQDPLHMETERNG